MEIDSRVGGERERELKCERKKGLIKKGDEKERRAV